MQVNLLVEPRLKQEVARWAKNARVKPTDIYRQILYKAVFGEPAPLVPTREEHELP